MSPFDSATLAFVRHVVTARTLSQLMLVPLLGELEYTRSARCSYSGVEGQPQQPALVVDRVQARVVIPRERQRRQVGDHRRQVEKRRVQHVPVTVHDHDAPDLLGHEQAARAVAGVPSW